MREPGSGGKYSGIRDKSPELFAARLCSSALSESDDNESEVITDHCSLHQIIVNTRQDDQDVYIRVESSSFSILFVDSDFIFILVRNSESNHLVLFCCSDNFPVKSDIEEMFRYGVEMLRASQQVSCCHSMIFSDKVSFVFRYWVASSLLIQCSGKKDCFNCSHYS